MCFQKDVVFIVILNNLEMSTIAFSVFRLANENRVSRAELETSERILSCVVLILTGNTGLGMGDGWLSSTSNQMQGWRMG